jgi:hypothetical protein
MTDLTFCPNPSTMQQNDLLAHRQTKTHAPTLALHTICLEELCKNRL